MSKLGDLFRQIGDLIDAQGGTLNAPGQSALPDPATLPPNTTASIGSDGKVGTIGVGATTLTLAVKTPGVLLTASASDGSPLHFKSNDPDLFTIQDPNPEYGNGNAILTTLSQPGHGTVAVSTDSGLAALIDVTVFQP